MCTQTQPTPYPKDSPTQYWFSTRCSDELTSLFQQWYVLDKNTNKKIKIFPQNLEQIFTEISLAFCLMGDGYWENDKKTVYICTENFTEAQVEELIRILFKKFGLILNSKNLRKATKKKEN